MPNNLGRAIDELYIIIDDDQESVLKTKAMADSFRAYFIANNEEGLNLILEHTPINFFRD
jgi:hypothetical protein